MLRVLQSLINNAQVSFFRQVTVRIHFKSLEFWNCAHRTVDMYWHSEICIYAEIGSLHSRRVDTTDFTLVEDIRFSFPSSLHLLFDSLCARLFNYRGENCFVLFYE